MNAISDISHRVIDDHAVLDASADAVWNMGAEVHRGDLTDHASLTAGARAADGIIHTAFIHDFSKFVENCEIDRRAIGHRIRERHTQLDHVGACVSE